jgi:glycosyltransferase involved in cell wall biosynthesis
LFQRKKENDTVKLPVSVIMLTFNEEYHLPGAIESIRNWAEDIFIVDSCSTDKTINIAQKHNINIVQRPFTDFGDQWNWALDNLPVKTPWTLKLDPDERLSPELKLQIEFTIRGPNALDGYSFPRRLWFMGKPLHVKQDVLRLWKTGKCRFSDVIVNEQPLIDGKVGRLNAFMEHYDSRDLHHWYNKQNRYSTMEAIIRLKGDKLAVEPKFWGKKLERRMFYKKWIWKIPCRYQILYLYHLLCKGAWRDGKVGRVWARLRTEVYHMRELKYIEMKINGDIPSVPKISQEQYYPRIMSSDIDNKPSIETCDFSIR